MTITSSVVVPAVIPVAMGPLAKSRRLETTMAHFAEGDINTGDSIRAPDSALYYISPNVHSVTPLDGCSTPFSRRCRRRASYKPEPAIITSSSVTRGTARSSDRYSSSGNPKPTLISLGELLESIFASLSELAQHEGLKLWRGVNV